MNCSSSASISATERGSAGGGITPPSFRHHVEGVVARRPQKQVRRIHTGPHVAPVQDVERAGRAEGERPRHPVRQLGSVSDLAERDLPVTLLGPRPCPEPALVGPAHRDLAPKPLREGPPPRHTGAGARTEPAARVRPGIERATTLPTDVRYAGSSHVLRPPTADW